MTPARPRRLHGEDGASLVFAMAFLLLFSVILAALLSFAVTSFKTGGEVGDLGRASYSANAAVDLAVTRISRDQIMQLGKSGGASCDLTYQPTDGTPAATAVCTPQPGSGAVRPGVDVPANAILTRNGPVTVNGPGRLRTTGNVFANGAITVAPGGTLDVHDWAIAATGACSPGPAALPSFEAVRTYCNATAATAPQWADGADPGWSPPAPPSQPVVDPTPTCTASNILTFSPGFYTNVAKLTSVPSTCSGAVPNVFYFEPGLYYFNLAGTTVWEIKGIVVGGTPLGNWYANSQVPPVPGDQATTAAACDPTGPGVQFVLTGESRIALGTPASGMAASSLELCPPPGATPAGRVAVFAGASSPSVAVSYTLRPSRVRGSTPYTPSGNTLPIPLNPYTSPIDGNHATASTSSRGQNARTVTIDLGGFDWKFQGSPPGDRVDIPGGMVVRSVRVRVRHRESGTSGYWSEVTIRVPGMGECITGQLVTAPGVWTDETVPCAGSLIGATSPSPSSQGAEFSGKMDVTYEASTAPGRDQSVVSNLDGLEILVDFDSPGGSPTGCVVAVGQNECSFFSNGAGAAGRAAFWGPVYGPLARLDVNFGGARHIVFNEGVIVRTLTVSGLPVTDATGRFRLRGGPGRTVELVTNPVPGVRIRALVRIVDSASAPGFLTAVREWSTAKP